MEQNMSLSNEFAPGVSVYSSVELENLSRDERVKYYNAINNSTKFLRDYVNMELDIVDMFAEQVMMSDKPAIRIVLIDSSGEGYSAVSSGVFSAMKKIIGIMGAPTWEPPITIRPKIIGSKEKAITTIELV